MKLRIPNGIRQQKVIYKNDPVKQKSQMRVQLLCLMPLTRKGMSNQDSANSESYEVQQILDKKIKNGVEQYLVKWVGYSVEEATWEPKRNLIGCSEILLKFEMSRMDQNMLKDMTEALQQEKDFEDNVEGGPLGQIQNNIQEVVGSEQKEQLISLRQSMDEFIRRQGEIAEGAQIQAIIGVCPRNKQQEEVFYYVQVKNESFPRKIASSELRERNGVFQQLVQYYEGLIQWQ